MCPPGQGSDCGSSWCGAASQGQFKGGGSELLRTTGVISNPGRWHSLSGMERPLVQSCLNDTQQEESMETPARAAKVPMIPWLGIVIKHRNRNFYPQDSEQWSFSSHCFLTDSQATAYLRAINYSLTHPAF